MLQCKLQTTRGTWGQPGKRLFCVNVRPVTSAHFHQQRLTAPIHKGSLQQPTQQANRPVTVRAQGDDGNGNQEVKNQSGIYFAAAALAMSAVATFGLTVYKEDLFDFFYADGFSDSSFGPADLAAGLLWGTSLFFATPYQLLLLFLGKIDVERPSDWIILRICDAMNIRLVDVNEAPGFLTPVAAAICMVGGVLTSWAIGAALGDSTWSLSTGLGACVAAGVYEVGRPVRLDKEEQSQLDTQWADFVRFANVRLQRGGRCHESEVYSAFRKEYARYRSQEAISDARIRDLIRNWHPGADRTPNGYYRNLSVVARIDAFTGKVEGTAPQQVAAATKAVALEPSSAPAASSPAEQPVSSIASTDSQ